jgi:hypothetical protein
VNIFEEYFEGLEPAPIVDRSSARTMYVYKDVESPTVSKINDLLNLMSRNVYEKEVFKSIYLISFISLKASD